MLGNFSSGCSRADNSRDTENDHLTVHPANRHGSVCSYERSAMQGTGALAVLLLSICALLTQGREIQYIAVSSDLTFDFGPCEAHKVYKLHYGGVTAHIFCDFGLQIPDRFEGRISIDKTTGSVTLHNVLRSDAGYYRLERTNGNGRKEHLPGVEVQVLDPVWIHELFHNNTDETISLTVGRADDLGAIIWTMDRRDLPDRHWLSPDNRTMTIPYNYTGAITVSNLVSADSKSITLTRDINGQSSQCGHVMYSNITRLIWGDGGGEPNMSALILPRNISTLCVLLTPSDETREPQWSNWKHFGWLALPVAIILVVVGILVARQCKKAQQK